MSIISNIVSEHDDALKITRWIDDEQDKRMCSTAWDHLTAEHIADVISETVDDTVWGERFDGALRRVIVHNITRRLNRDVANLD